MALLAAWTLENVIAVLYVALGLGFVIFVHELGHFAVAKWCNVKVERFSIGFGPVLWSKLWGETQYALSLIPFGGYVKMLGQDDADPSQLADDDVRSDPRSYTSKPVGQRMAIISAGVIMNIIFGALFFVIAFMNGIQIRPPLIGFVGTATPAWNAGLRTGDKIEKINGKRVHRFSDIQQGVALSGGPLKLQVQRGDLEFDVVVEPETGGMIPMIGIAPATSLTLLETSPDLPVPVASGTPAAAAKPPVQAGDTIVQVDGLDVPDYLQLQTLMAERRDKTVELTIERGTERIKTKVGPNQVRTLGLRMAIGPITAIQAQSPASRSQLRLDDRITHVISDQGQREVGIDLNPLEVPEYLAGLHGQQIRLMVKRNTAGGDPESVEVPIVPENRAGWLERPGAGDTPLSVPALGIAFHVLPHVLKVDPGSPAAGKIGALDAIKRAELVLPEGQPADFSIDRKIAVVFSDKKGDAQNWAYLFWLMQEFPARKVSLTVSSQGAGEERTVLLAPVPAPDWFIPTRGFALQPLVQIQRADDIGEALSLGLRHTVDSMTMIYLTLRSLANRQISPKAMHGPLGIAGAAFQTAKEGIADFLVFLGFLSVNLAVLNFLPIPVLDGGHMVFLIWEVIRGKPPSERVMIGATYVGFAFVLSLMVWVIYLDLFVH